MDIEKLRQPKTDYIIETISVVNNLAIPWAKILSNQNKSDNSGCEGGKSDNSMFKLAVVHQVIYNL